MNSELIKITTRVPVIIRFGYEEDAIWHRASINLYKSVTDEIAQWQTAFVYHVDDEFSYCQRGIPSHSIFNRLLKVKIRFDQNSELYPTWIVIEPKFDYLRRTISKWKRAVIVKYQEIVVRPENNSWEIFSIYGEIQ